MTNEETLKRTVELCDARLLAELEQSELTLIDTGASAVEIEAAIGRDGYLRKQLEQDRAAQIAEVRAWLFPQ